MTDMDFRVWAR